MDQETSKVSEVLDHVDKGVYENLSNLVEGVGRDEEAGHSLGERVSVRGEDGTSEEMGKEFGLNEVKEGPLEVKGQSVVGDSHKIDDELCRVDQGSGTIYSSSNSVIRETLGLNEEVKERPLEVKGERVVGDSHKIDDELCRVDQGSETIYSSSNSVIRETLETCVVMDSSAQVEYVNGHNRKLEAKTNESGSSKLSIKVPKGVSETDKSSYVIDINCGGCRGFSENLDGEMVCRICHLVSGQPLESTSVGAPNSADNCTDMIMLGCACKGELGIAHSHCAEAWFKIKGNRLCEICGETAKNVSDVTDRGFMEEWCESGFIENGSTSPRRLVGCWREQPFCNFLMSCLVIAFVLPWFFRVKFF